MLAAQSSSRVASSLVAAAVRAAAALDNSMLAGLMPELLVDGMEAIVSERLDILRPILITQAVHGSGSGEHCHSPADVASRESILKANVTKHAGLDNLKFVSEMSKNELRAIQRGARTNAKARKLVSNDALSEQVGGFTSGGGHETLNYYHGESCHEVASNTDPLPPVDDSFHSTSHHQVLRSKLDKVLVGLCLILNELHIAASPLRSPLSATRTSGDDRELDAKQVSSADIAVVLLALSDDEVFAVLDNRIQPAVVSRALPIALEMEVAECLVKEVEIFFVGFPQPTADEMHKWRQEGRWH